MCCQLILFHGSRLIHQLTNTLALLFLIPLIFITKEFQTTEIIMFRGMEKHFIVEIIGGYRLHSLLVIRAVVLYVCDLFQN